MRRPRPRASHRIQTPSLLERGPILRYSCPAQLGLWRAASVVLLVATLVLAAACSDDNSAPAASRSAASSTTPAAAAPTVAGCETPPPTSPREDTIFDKLSKGASTLGDFHPDFAVTVGDAAAGAGADLTYEIRLPADQPNFQAFFLTLPEEWRVTPGCALPLGANVGELDWLTTLGIVNAPCNLNFPISFAMRNASIDTSQLFPFVDDNGNIIDGFEQDKDGNGLPDVIERYPNLLDRVFAGRKPIRREVGLASIARIQVIVQTLLFGPLEDVGGQTLVILFQDFPTARTTVSRTVITDQCTPFALTLKERGTGDKGEVLQQNPAAGSYTFALTAFGLRDADGDGIENALDTCPFDVNVGDPRVPGDGDADLDGLDAACDPNDLVANADEDGDKTLNRGDLCPLVPGRDPTGAQKDTDFDQIGDECDVYGKGPNAGDGDVILSAVGQDIVIQ